MYNNDAEAIIKAARENQVVEIAGVKYSNDHFQRVKSLPILNTLKFSSLETLANFITEDPITHKVLNNPIIQIEDNHKVHLMNIPNEETLSRTVVASVNNPLEPFAFNSYKDIETMIIQLQTKFVKTEEIDKLLILLSSLGTTKNVGLTDNGTSQTVSVKMGVSAASLKEVDLPPVIKLKPIRVFTECEQVESNFLFRIKENDDIPYVALMDIDPTSWKLKASKSIKNKMQEFGIKIPIYY